jgi:arylsulfatase A-like enzyme
MSNDKDTRHPPCVDAIGIYDLGRIDPSRDKSSPDWPKRPSATKGAPNVVLILLDDVGFGASSTFGGPVATPALSQLAATGLRYNRFHVNAMCSPTRGALLSGRNSHEVGFGVITESAAGYPGYNSVWPRSSASIAQVPQLNGYSTAVFGKWHNTPVWALTTSTVSWARRQSVGAHTLAQYYANRSVGRPTRQLSFDSRPGQPRY